MPEFEYQDREAPQFFVAAGDYVLGVEAAELGLSKNSGNEQIKLTLRVLAGPDQPGSKTNGVLPPHIDNGPTVFDYLVFGEKSDWKIDTFLKAIKRQPKKGEKLVIDDAWLKGNIIGAVCWATLTVDEYNGRKNNKIGAYITNHKIDPAAAYEKDDVPI